MFENTAMVSQILFDVYQTGRDPSPGQPGTHPGRQGGPSIFSTME